MADDRRRPAIVCVPVRDEAILLPRFLDALTAQADAGDVTLCILFDTCTDDSEAIVERRRAAVPFDIVTRHAVSTAPNAGRARRGAMALGMALAENDTVILSTDADSVSDQDWLAANRAALAVADVAAGRIVRDGASISPVQDRVEAYYDALFALRRAIDPVPWEAAVTHHYTSGASLAFRAGVYRALGGFEPLPSAEDARLIDAAHRAGYRVRRDAAIRVETSSRRTGRALGGLADHLRRLDGEGGAAAASMAHPDDVAWRYAGHAAARAAWGDIAGQAPALSAGLGVSPADVRQVAAAAPNAEAFAMRIVPDIPGGERIVMLDEAERALARLRDDRRTMAA